ncbi:MAG: hypothetical protein KC546_10855 [Anaerolineae bacterium]|nr:hypothetical protein [Anaerolineae bacterium]MCA9888865.1 hypothetical protein [Anaerolineae bacterium]MCA9893955.1 hypothetical protein [Anaerolineae bacterium]
MDEALEASRAVNNALGLNMGEMAAQAIFAMNVTMVAFWIVAPMLGIFGQGIIGRWKDTFFAISSAILVGVVTNVAVNFGLRYLMQDRMSELSIGVIAVISAFSLAWLAGRTVAFALAPPGKGYYRQQEEALEEDELMPFEQRRRKYQERRNRILGD